MDIDEAGSPRHTRLHIFPGGILETADYGDDNCGGFYLEFSENTLRQRVPHAVPVQPIASADSETCRRVLRLLHEWDRPDRDLPAAEERVFRVMLTLWIVVIGLPLSVVGWALLPYLKHTDTKVDDSEASWLAGGLGILHERSDGDADDRTDSARAGFRFRSFIR